MDGVVGERIREKLTAALRPSALEIIDESRKHAGHAHVVARAGTAAGVGETHFRIRIVADSFRGATRIDRHRKINGLLAEELSTGVHALAIEAKAPGE